MTNTTFYPTFAKTKVTRPNIPGRDVIEKHYHKSLEQGRMMEASIGDAIYNLKEAKKDLEEKVRGCMSDVKLALDGKLPTTPRAVKYAANAKKFLSEAKKYINEITKTIQSLVRCITLLTSILNRIKQMIQAISNSLANLLAEVCNWNLPELPSFPFLLGGLSYGFPGFNLEGINLKQQLKFNTTFTFPTCQIKLPENPFRDYTGSLKIGDLALDNRVVSVVSGPIEVGGKTLTMPINPITHGPVVSQELQDDASFVTDFLTPASTIPFVSYTFDPTTQLNGSLVSADAILNNHHLSPEDYGSNVASLVPLDLGDDFRKTLRSLTLERIYDNRKSHEAAAWILYLNENFKARKGLWVSEFKQVFNQWILPSVDYLSTADIPYNRNSSEPSVPFLVTIESLTPTDLWKLSYVEASLLGYTRSTRWDLFADPSWFGFTGDALDFYPASKSVKTETLVLDSQGQAAYPQTMIVPANLAPSVSKAIQKAEKDIQINPEWRTSRPQFRFVYDQYGLATEVDRFSQFWREWKDGMDRLLKDESNSFILPHYLAIDSYVNPLSSPSIASYVKEDMQTRDFVWKPGDALIPKPTPISIPADMNTTPSEATSGWVKGKFNPEVFLARPDIKLLPITAQLAMMDLNQIYSDVLETSREKEEVLLQEIEQLKTSVSASIVHGFSVLGDKPQTLKPGDKSLLKFPQVEVDIVNCVTAPNLFTIQTKGQYEITGEFEFSPSVMPFIRSVDLCVNGKIVSTASSFPTSSKVMVDLNYVVDLVPGDIVQIKAYHQGAENITLNPEFKLACLFTDLNSYLTEEEPDPTGGTDPGSISGTYNWEIVNSGQREAPAGTNLASLTAVYLNSDGKALPIHPELDVNVIPYFDGLTLKGAKANESVSIALGYGNEYKIVTNTAPGSQPSQSGSGEIVQETTGVAPDGTELVSPLQGSMQAGSLLYVGPGGQLTHDYEYVKANCRWIVVVGRATSPQSFVFEPHLPIDQQQGGGSGVIGTYTHTQSTPSMTWTINHNLGRYVNVEVYDSDNDAVVRDLTFIDLNTVVVRLVVPTTGHAACS